MKTLLLTIFTLFTSQTFAQQDSIDLSGIEVVFQESLNEASQKISTDGFSILLISLKNDSLYDISKDGESDREGRIKEGEQKALEIFAKLKSNNSNILRMLDTFVIFNQLVLEINFEPYYIPFLESKVSDGECSKLSETKYSCEKHLNYFMIDMTVWGSKLFADSSDLIDHALIDSIPLSRIE